MNDAETGANHALTGTVLATSIGTPAILDYDQGSSFPTTSFAFDGTLLLESATKYVFEIVQGPGVGTYVKASDEYSDGQAYCIDGANLTFARDIPFSLFIVEN